MKVYFMLLKPKVVGKRKRDWGCVAFYFIWTFLLNVFVLLRIFTVKCFQRFLLRD